MLLTKLLGLRLLNKEWKWKGDSALEKVRITHTALDTLPIETFPSPVSMIVGPGSWRPLREMWLGAKDVIVDNIRGIYEQAEDAQGKLNQRVFDNIKGMSERATDANNAFMDTFLPMWKEEEEGILHKKKALRRRQLRRQQEGKNRNASSKKSPTRKKNIKLRHNLRDKRLRHNQPDFFSETMDTYMKQREELADQVRKVSQVDRNVKKITDDIKRVGTRRWRMGKIAK